MDCCHIDLLQLTDGEASLAVHVKFKLNSLQSSSTMLEAITRYSEVM